MTSLTFWLSCSLCFNPDIFPFISAVITGGVLKSATGVVNDGGGVVNSSGGVVVAFKDLEYFYVPLFERGFNSSGFRWKGHKVSL